jgi:hypothetical protein
MILWHIMPERGWNRKYIIVEQEESFYNKRLNQSLKFVAQLKTRYQKPIIGLYGWPKEVAYGRRARMAGADFVFSSPPEPSELRAAVVDCLEPVLG